MKLHKLGRNSICRCGSGKKYKLCCGRNRASDEPYYMSDPIPMSELPPGRTHHFFCVDTSDTTVSSMEEWPTITDAQGRVLVFLSRSDAANYMNLHHDGVQFGTVGMGDEKWELFQHEVEYVVFAAEN